MMVVRNIRCLWEYLTYLFAICDAITFLTKNMCPTLSWNSRSAPWKGLREIQTRGRKGVTEVLSKKIVFHFVLDPSLLGYIVLLYCLNINPILCAFQCTSGNIILQFQRKELKNLNISKTQQLVIKAKFCKFV